MLILSCQVERSTSMFKQILVPLDGSARAEQALPVTARLARATNGTVTLVQAVYPPDKFMESVGTIVLPDILDEDVPAAKEYLEGVAKTSSLEGIHIATKAVTGHPAQSILAEANADNVDLIVLSSHGYTNVVHWSMGSIAEKVARHAPSPVLILHECCALTTEAGTAPHGSIRVLVPLDGSEHAEASIVPAALLVSVLSAPARGELHLTRVVYPAGGEASGFKEEVARTQQYLRSVVERLQHHPLTDAGVPLDLLMTWSVTVADDAASGIIQAAEKSGKGEYAGQDEGCQVIAMATHGLGGPQLWAMGSTTERVLQAARQPLLIVRR
jgi:nucleotide-binding universal stress UspA family protein